MNKLICPECGTENSSDSKVCEKCGYSLQPSSKKKAIIIIAVMLLVLAGAGFGVYEYHLYTVKQAKIAAAEKKKAEEEKQAKIDELLEQVQDNYKKCAFEDIEKNYEELEKLGYELGSKRDVLEYDKKVSEDIIEFRKVLKSVDSKLDSGSYTSLRSELNNLKKPMEKIKNLETNPYSKLSDYAVNIKSNMMFQMLDRDYVNSTEYDVDYGLTQSGYAMIITTYTDELLKVSCPID